MLFFKKQDNDLKTLKGSIENQNNQVYQFFLDQGFNDDELTRGMVNITDARSNLYNNNSQYSGFRYLSKSEFTVRTKDIKKLQKALSESLNLMSKGIVLGSKNEWRPIEYIFTPVPRTQDVSSKDFDSIKAMFYKDVNSAYQILEITSSANEDEIKKAYRKMAIKYHPDKVSVLGEEFQKAAKEKFQKVQEAYETIKKEKGIN